LADIGPQLSRKVVELIESDRTGRDPERILSEWCGRSLFSSRLARWAKEIRSTQAPVYFRPSPFRSIYRAAFSPLPASFFFDSDTVRLHGYYMGTDKIDHFFRQGYEYFELVSRKQAEGADPALAIAAAVRRGVLQEHTYFGTIASGVYSNADLAANFAGMKFYLNLRQPVRIAGELRAPMFIRSDNGWRLAPNLDPDRLLEPFLSDHLDESLNPSRYRFSRGAIRSVVRNRCQQWSHFYSDRAGLVASTSQSFARQWFGEDYGHWLPPAEEISIASECTGMALTR
jgi:hypothetical protein